MKRYNVHGMSYSSEYKSWRCMKDRCSIISNKSYKHYGAKGITVCERWLNSFENFYSDMGPKPTPKHSIDRKNPLGNYEPDNCKWSTNAEQQKNRANNMFVEIKREKILVKDYAALVGHSITTLVRRYKSGLRGEDLIKPAKKNMSRIKQPLIIIDTPKGLMSLKEASESYKIKLNTLRDRYGKGWKGEDLLK